MLLLHRSLLIGGNKSAIWGNDVQRLKRLQVFLHYKLYIPVYDLVQICKNINWNRMNVNVARQGCSKGFPQIVYSCSAIVDRMTTKSCIWKWNQK